MTPGAKRLPADAGLPEALERASAEARLWASALAQLEADLATAVAEEDNRGQGIQEIDRIRQGIEGLGRFLGFVASATGAGAGLDLQAATAALGMRSQILRLTGCEGPELTPRLAEPELWQEG